MTIKVGKIVVGGKSFTEASSKRQAPQETASTERSVQREPQIEEEVVEVSTSSFIIKRSSKFHRDMID